MPVVSSLTGPLAWPSGQGLSDDFVQSPGQRLSGTRAQFPLRNKGKDAVDVDKTNIGNLTDGLAMDTVVSEGSMEMDANDMDANDSQASRQVQLVNDDSALPCQHNETAEAGVQSPPVEVEVSLPGNENDVVEWPKKHPCVP